MVMNINWNDAPEWAQWVAQDADGEWYWYEEKPSILGTLFFAKGRTEAIEQADLDWRESLQQRPQTLSAPPSWDDAPERAQWLAQDEDGWWVWYDDKPTLGRGQWEPHGTTHPTRQDTSNAGWQESLQPRPVKVPLAPGGAGTGGSPSPGEYAKFHSSPEGVTAFGAGGAAPLDTSALIDRAADDGRIYALRNPIHAVGSDPAHRMLAHAQPRAMNQQLFLPWRAVTDAEIAAHGAAEVLEKGWVVWIYTIPHEFPLSVSEKLTLDLLLQRKLQK